MPIQDILACKPCVHGKKDLRSEAVVLHIFDSFLCPVFSDLSTICYGGNIGQKTIQNVFEMATAVF